MKASQSFLATLKEAPSDAEVVSHKLMVRAGLIRKLSAGVYNYLPLGLKVIRKVENIIRGLKERGIPMVLVSHNLRQVFDLVDRIVVFRRGRIVIRKNGEIQIRPAVSPDAGDAGHVCLFINNLFGFAELVDELVGLAADGRIEDRLGVIVGRIAQDDRLTGGECVGGGGCARNRRGPHWAVTGPLRPGARFPRPRVRAP